MDFRELTYVTMVAECKSVTAAAKKAVHIPALLKSDSLQGGAGCGGEAV